MKRAGLLAGVGLLLGAFALRTAAITRMPLFIDEATHIYWVHRMLEGQFFIALQDQKWLYPFLLSAFNPTGPEAPWIARTLSALLSLLTVSCTVSLTGLLFRASDKRRAVGLFAGLVYAVLPMAVFHERQALVDPALAACTALCTLGAVRLVRRPRLGSLLLLALSLALAYLAKLAALPYLILPFAAALLLVPPGKPRQGSIRRPRLRALLAGVAADLAALPLIALPYAAARSRGITVSSQFRASVGNTLFEGLLSPANLAVLQINAHDAADALIHYLGPVLLALCALAVVLLVWRKHRAERLFLLIPAFAFLIVPVVARQVTETERLPPRYLLPHALPVVVLAVITLFDLLDLLRRRWPRLPAWVGTVCAAAILLPSLWFGAVLIANPRQANYSTVDHGQYLTHRDDYGTQALAAALLEAQRSEPERRIDVLGPGVPVVSLHAYLGPRTGWYETLRVDDPDQRAELVNWLAAGDRVFVFASRKQPDQLADPYGAETRFTGEYGGWRLVEVSGASGELASDIYTRLAGDPQFMADDFAALAAALDQDPAAGAALVFPPEHADALAELPGRSVTPLAVDEWPLTPALARRALTMPAQAGESGAVDLVLVNEDALDPLQVIALAALESLYRTGEEDWFGPLHRRRYVTGPPDPAWQAFDGVFEGVITLSQVAVVDQAVAPGGVLRLALAWQTAEPVGDSFSVFTHVVDQVGALVAQADGVPGGGLLPMPSWQPGEQVTDRFAVRLPPDLPSGTYEIRIGIYRPESGQRLAATAGQSRGPDYVMIGRFIVEP